MSPPRPRILFADDELGLRELATFVLEPLGYDVVTASTGLEALELVGRQAFELVILDEHMPVMTGSEALSRIRSLRPEQRVVIVTGSSDHTSACERRAREQGAIDYLCKPLSLEELTAAIVRNMSPEGAPHG